MRGGREAPRASAVWGSSAKDGAGPGQLPWGVYRDATLYKCVAFPALNTW